MLGGRWNAPPGKAKGKLTQLTTAPILDRTGFLELVVMDSVWVFVGR